ncbi:Uncharacterised protein [Shigella sonnei]|nr:Uncharacterised protein [Shigella sonnei]
MGQRIMVRHQTSNMMTQRDHAGTGQRRHINHRFRLKTFNVS